MTDRVETPSSVSVILSMTKEARDHPDAVLRAAEAAGLVVEEAMPSVGVIAGSAEPSALPGLRLVPGVEAVEEEREAFAFGG